MDTVVEFPETQEEEEGRREGEMDSLYQIRMARRREIEEQEERRQERREARARGDYARLEELRREARARTAAATAANQAAASTSDLSAATLIAEHRSRGRDRRVSAVTYAEVGHVRHDGTRLRANSQESEHGGLLAGAAPMGEGQGRSRGLSDTTSMYAQSNLSRPHVRGRSTSSVASVATTVSDLDNSAPGRATPISTQPDDRAPRSSYSDMTPNSSPTTNRFTPVESSGSDDIGDSRIPEPASDLPQPPNYEHLDWGDAPAYEAAMQARRAASTRVARAGGQPVRVASTAPQLPRLSLPSIYVEGATEPNTPVTPSATSTSHATP